MSIPFAIIGTSLSCKRDPHSWECTFMKFYDVFIGLVLLFCLYTMFTIFKKSR